MAQFPDKTNKDEIFLTHLDEQRFNLFLKVAVISATFFLFPKCDIQS